ncbi:hypothetical protein [Dankookia sp. P2]|uniref:hypothetical protein n=1 Tax=Dankookia sp. P2 TaxID=3423955 RepID=UPI003D6773E2
MNSSLSLGPAMLPPARLYAIIDPKNLIVLFTIVGLAVNELIGPPFIAISLGLWAIYCLKDVDFLIRSLTMAGIFPGS